jgi:hypothetical protein
MANPNGWQIAEQIDELPARCPVRPSAHFHPALRTAGEIMAASRQAASADWLVVDIRSTVLVVVADD